MTDTPHILTSHAQCMLRIGQAAFPDRATRRVALALGSLAQPADVAGATATVCIDPETVNQVVNAHVGDVWAMGQPCELVTMGQTITAIDTLVAMEVIHETAKVIGPWRVHLIDTAALVSRIDPVLDFCGPEPDYGIGFESETSWREEAA